ncbi:unnamed protein product [Peniophora sp. CBMAI 1063]|nr:unnamed protein product [Peniophora sp. CBMAI 1063]
MMASLASLRPSLAHTLCKRRLNAYLSSSTRHAHTTVPATPGSTVRPSRKRKAAREADAAEPSNAPARSPHYGKLKPYDLSQRLRALIDKDELDAAVTTLKNMPLAAQSASVWNTVIKALFDAGKLKLAYSLYTDMKRRGFKPNLRTYTTMMSGYHRIRSWEGLSSQLQNTHTVYQSFMAHVEAISDSLDPDTVPAVRAAINQYLDICCLTRQSTELEEAFVRVPVHGPLCRDARMYAPYLRDLLQQELPPATLAAGVREVWREVQEIREKDPEAEPKTYVFLADLIFRGLSQSPSIADHSLAFEIVRDVFALHPKGKALPSKRKDAWLPPSTFVHILSTANLLGRPDIVLDMAKLIPRRVDLRVALDMSVVHQVLFATREVKHRNNGKVLSNLVQVIAEQNPQQLDKAPLTIQGTLKACADCGDFAGSKNILSAVLRLRSTDLASNRRTPHAKSVTTTAWAYFARAALHGNASDAKLALHVLKEQAHHLIEDVISDRPVKGAFKLALAQTLVQLTDRTDNSAIAPWYHKLRASVDSYSGARSHGDSSLPSDDPFAPGAVDATSEPDTLELTEDIDEPGIHVAPKAIGSDR